MATSLPPRATPNALPALAPVGAPTAAERAAGHEGAASHPFAELLRERQNAGAAPKPTVKAEPSTPAPSEARSETPADAQGETDPAPAQHATTPAKTRAPIAKSATGKASVDSAHSRAEPVASHAGRADDGVASTAPTSTGERACSLAALAAATAAYGSAAPVASAADASADAPPASTSDDDAANALSAVAPDGPQGDGAHARGQAVVDAASGRAALVDASIARATSAVVDPGFRAALGDAVRTDNAPTRSRATFATDAAAATIAAGSASRVLAEPQGLAGAPGALALATPIDAPDFAAALGIQVSLLAHDGVQRAELHLHPAETGPVSIHIAVDGNAARVDFGADHAATRLAIERGLPELASALRDAGLTLTGGGVSQHAGSRQGGDDGAAPSQGRAGSTAALPPLATTARIGGRTAAGAVDLYA